MFSLNTLSSYEQNRLCQLTEKALLTRFRLFLADRANIYNSHTTVNSLLEEFTREQVVEVEEYYQNGYPVEDQYAV